MQKRYSGRLSPAAVYIGLTLLCVGLLGFVGCADPIAQEGNQIVSFVINDIKGVINDEERTITVTMPGGTDLETTLFAPGIKISSGATVDPASGTEVLFDKPIAYVVQAENGDVRHYTVRAVLAPASVLTGISVEALKTTYDVGVASIPAADVVVTGHYQDGSTKIENTGVTLGGYDSTKAGPQKVLVTFNEKTATYDVEFVSYEGLESIIVKLLKTTNYDNGDDIIPLTDILVTGTYRDGSTRTETIEAAHLKGYDKTKAGSQTVVVDFKGKTATFTVTVNTAKELTDLVSLEVTAQLEDTFDIGTDIADILDQTVITGTYSDGTSARIVDFTAATVTGYDDTRAGSQTIRVVLGERAISFTVKVISAQADEDLVSLTVTAQLQNTFVKGTDIADILDQTVITGTYSDGTSAKIVNFATATVTGYDENRVGAQTVRVAIGERAITFTVTVTSAKDVADLTGLTVTQLESTFSSDTTLVDILDKIVITGTYSDGTTATVPNASATVTGFVPGKVGSQTLRVAIGEKAASFTVTITAEKIDANLTSISVFQLKTTFLSGSSLDEILDEIVITGTYSDGTTATVPNASATVTGFVPGKVGSQTLRVVVGTRVTTFNVTIEQSPSTVNITVGLPSNGSDVPFFIGSGTGDVTIPGDNIIRLSASGNNSLPKALIINAAGFTSVTWYVDDVSQGASSGDSRILNLTASDYTYGNEHTITFTGTRNNVQFSRTIWFVVEN